MVSPPDRDPLIGRFISPDSTGQKLTDPQSLNRYTYCLNNPLNRTDPTGHWPNWGTVGKFFKGVGQEIVSTAVSVVSHPLPVNLYTTTRDLYQRASGQKPWYDNQAFGQMINGIKDRYDITTPEGAGHLAGFIAIIATTAGIGGGESAGCDVEEAASDAGNATESLVSKAATKLRPSAEQQDLLNLAAKIADKGGMISRNDASILTDWAQDLKINDWHDIMSHSNKIGSPWEKVDHIDIAGFHIRILDP